MHTSTPALADSRRPHAGMLSHASLIHQSDDRLVALARSGSERAWSEITRRYGRQLRTYCARFVGVSRAEDAVQQTFLQAFLALRDGAEREIALRAWLYRIAHNCSIDLLRKCSPDYDQLDLEYDGVAQPPMLFEQREEVRRLVARMRDLPDAQRQALALRELEGRSYEEISARLGHSGSGVRQLIFRARTTLRNSVAGFIPFGFLKARLSQPSAYDLHHVATAAAVPASSGNGIETVSAATLAVVAVLGGGFAATDGRSRGAKPRSAEQAVAASPSVAVAGPAVRSAPPAADMHAPTGGALSVRLEGRGRTTHPTDLSVPVAAAPAVAVVVPVAPPGPPPTIVLSTEVTPAPASPPAPSSDAQAGVRQQSRAPSGAGGVPGSGPAAAPVGSSPGGTAPATGPGTIPSDGQQKPSPTPPPAKGQPRKVQAPKPQPPKSQPKASAPKAVPGKTTPMKAPAPNARKPARKSERG